MNPLCPRVASRPATNCLGLVRLGLVGLGLVGLGLVGLSLFAGPAAARVEGEPHRLYRQHRLFGDAVATGNTLMQASVADPRVNSFLLPESGADVQGIPFDGELVAAYLFWSGSLAGQVDREVTLRVADGVTFREVAAERCFTVNALGGFFYCRADVTAQVAAHPGPQRFNGRYAVGDVRADPGTLVPDGQGGITCADPQTCQAKYAAWSLVIVYESRAARSLRDVFVYDGFRNYDETARTPGIEQFDIAGFDFPQNGEASLSYFALEGDAFLGVPPQDTDPLFPCDTCFDFMEVNGRPLQDGLNPAGNLFNSSTALGVDLEGFRVSGLLPVGSQRATIRVGSGDGIVNQGNPDPGGGGESFFLGYVLLNVDRNAPDFRRDRTVLSVVPDEGAPRERVVLTLRIENEGTLDADGVSVRLALPRGLSYLPGSLRVDGEDPVPGEEAINPLAAGFELGRIPHQGNTGRTITLRATIDADARPGDRLVSQAFISADNLDAPTPTNEAVLVVLGGLELGQVTKRVTETDGDGRFSPGELVRYDIFIPNPNARDVGGVQLRDVLPPTLELLQVVAPGGDDRSQPRQNLVDVRELNVPGQPGGGLTVTALARIRDPAGLVAAGVPAGGINGFVVENVAEVEVAGRILTSDDPTTPAVGDPTRFALSAAVDIRGPLTRKSVVDLNGGFVEPGDVLRFTIQIANSGTAPAEVFVSDPLPRGLVDCVLESALPDVSCVGGRLQGLVGVPAGQQVQVVFTARVAPDAVNGQVIRNVARLRAGADPEQQPEVATEPLQVFASPSLAAASKVAVDRGDGVAIPGDRLRYEIRVPNTGNRVATGVVIRDPIAFEFAEVTPLDGGVFDPDSRTVTWAVGDLPPGAEVVVRLEVLLPPALADGVRLSNQARVTAQELAEPEPTDDPATRAVNDPTVLVVRSQARLQVQKTVAPREARPGEAVTWRLQVRNDGTDAARGLVVEDPLPLDALVPGSVVAVGGVVEGGGVRFALDAPLEVGATRELVIEGRLQAVLADGLRVENQATARAEGVAPRLSDDPTTPEPGDPTALVVRSQPAFSLTKRVVDLNGGRVQPGDRLRYEIALTATGDAPLTELVIEDPIPPELTEVVAEAPGRVVERRVVWAVPGPVRPDDPAPLRLSFEATVRADLPAGTRIRNQAQALTAELPRQLSDDPSTPAPDDATVVEVFSEAELRATKTVEPPLARPGEEVTWRIVLRNQGSALAAGVEVQDTLPPELEVLAAPGAGVAGQDVRWALGVLAPREERVLTIQTRLRRPLESGVVFNQARLLAAGSLEGLSDDPGLPGEADPTPLQIDARPELQVEKTVEDLNGGVVAPGDRLRYGITVRNVGGSAAADVTVVDPLDGGLVFEGLEGPGRQVGDRLEWQIARIPADGVVQLSFTARVAAGVANGTVIFNQAQLRFGRPALEVLSDDPRTPEPADPTRVQVVSAVDLSALQKTVEALDGPDFRPGGRVRYRIIARNNGDAVAEGLVLSDPVPGELEVLDPGGAAQAGASLVWRRPALGPGEHWTVSFEARIRRPLDDGTVVSNRAEIGAVGVAAPFRSDDPSTPEVDATRFTVVAAPSLALSKRVEAAGGLPLRPGDRFQYVIELENRGDAIARGLTIEDPLPAGLAEVRAVPPAVLAAGVARLEVAALAPEAAPARLVVEARVPPDAVDGTVFVNQAAVGPLRSDDPATPAVGDATRVQVRDGADFTASPKTVDGALRPGGEVRWLIRVRNRGTAAAEDVRVSDDLPAGVRFLGAQPPPVSEGPLRWALGAMAPGEEVAILIRGVLDEGLADGTVIANQAFIEARDLPAVGSDDPAAPGLADPTRFVVEAQPQLELVKVLEPGEGGRAPGSRVLYRLELRNTGAGPARGIELIDPVAPELEGVVAEDARVDGGVVTWQIEEIPPGGRQVLLLEARIRAEVPLGTEVLNQAAARIGDGPLLRSEEVAFVVEGPRYRLLKSVATEDPRGFVPGARVRYTLTFENLGAEALLGAQVLDPVDLARLDQIEPLDGGLFDPRRGTVEWGAPATPQLARVEPGAQVQVGLVARILPALGPEERIENQATAQARSGPPVPSDDPALPGPADPTVIVVVGGPAWDLQKDIVAPRRPEIVAGGEVTYRFELVNRGAAAGEGAVLQDPLPPELTYVPGSTRMNGQPVPDGQGGVSPLREGLRLQGRSGRPGRVEPGERIRVELSVRVQPGLAAGTTVANQGRLVDAGERVVLSDDPTTPQGGDPTRFTLGGRPDLGEVQKTFQIVDGGGRERAVIGDVIEWQVAVTNRGSGPASEVVIQDPLPANTRFVPGSIRVDEAPVTDAVDGDQGALREGSVEARAARLEVGQTLSLRFQTTVEAGPSLRNQARVAAAGEVERASAVVVVAVGDAPRRALEITKTVVDPDGPPALAGQRLRYIVTLQNTGSVALEGLVVVDDLPPGLVAPEGVELPVGAALEVAPAPAGAFGNGQLRLVGVGLAPGAQSRFSFEAQVDPRLRADREICNRAQASGAQLVPQESAPACVEAVVRFGRVAGVAFQDLDRDGAFDPAVDQAFAGMRVAAYPAEDPDGAPVLELRTAEDGQFSLEDLLPGEYRLRVFSATETLLKTVEAVAVRASETREQALIIEPTGRVYETGEGALVDGAEVFIYRDEDLDDDPFDAESLAARVLVPPEELEAASQQGQRTAHGGLYRFAVRQPGRYLVEVVPPGPSFVSPSVLVPPTPGVAFSDDPERRVVLADLPSTDPRADRTYFTAFQLEGLEDGFKNNHLPIDPLSALIDLEKRSLRRQALIGEVVTWEIDIVNRSPQDLRYDPAVGTGGVYLQDVLPRGLKYVAGSAVLSRVEGGRELPLAADDPTGARLLRFGRVVEVGGRRVLRPLDLHAGESLRLRYQTVVGADARPRERYTNRATLLSDGSVPISRTARASVLVLADPDFDQGLVIGKVYCDTNGDGRQQPGEPGLPGARLYMDHGYSAVTDGAGLFHFKDLDPGTHAVKVDADSLLPGAAFTTDALRTFSFTRGLPVKVEFGVTCPTEAVSGAQLMLAEGGAAAALEALRAKATVITGEVEALLAQADEGAGQAPQVGLELSVDGTAAEGRDLALRGGGVAGELVFSPKVPADVEVARWAIRLGPFGEEGAAILVGTGRPPAQVPWDQRSLDGLSVLAPGTVYGFRLEVVDADGVLATSPPGRFGVGVGQIELGELVLRISAEELDAKGRLSRQARAALAEVLPKLKAAATPVVVEGHTDNQAGPLTARRDSRSQAEALQAALIEGGVPAARISADGVGGSRPLVPNIVPRNQAKNRRLEVWLRDPQGGAQQRLPAFEAAPVVRVGREVVSPGPDGRFAVTAEVPPDGVVEVFMEASDGRRAVIPLRLRPGSPAAQGVPRRLEIGGRLPGELTLGGAAVAIAGLDARVQGPAQVPLDESGRPAAPVSFALSAPGEIARWRLALQGSAGPGLTVAEGTGSLPAQVAWRPAPGAPLLPGRYVARLTARRADHVVAQSPPFALTLGTVTGADLAPAPPGGWRLTVDGQPLAPAPDGALRGQVEIQGEAAVLFELQDPEGARAVFFVPPPRPAAPGAPAMVVPPPADAGLTPLAPMAGGDADPGQIPRPRKLRSQVRDPFSGEADAGAGGPAGPGRPGLPQEERARMAEFGRRELLALAAPLLGEEGPAVPARELTVALPPAGAELGGPSLPVRGTTAPGNQILINGQAVPVDEAGRFSGVAPIDGEGQVQVIAVDGQGNRAAITRRYPVKPYRYFILALGESTLGTRGAELDGVESHTHLALGDRIYLHGRAAAFFKGYAKGADILGGAFEQLEATVHLDTARRREFETYFRQIVDAEAFYPVYGDSARETKEANTRGPLYVALRADENQLTVGNFRTQLRGVELFNYDRALYGAALQVKQPTGDFRHELRAFVSDVDQPERHAYVELRGTGGSLYYLPHRELIEGSERLYLVERDRISNIERRKTLLNRNVDYNIQYRDGRILMKSPVPSVTLDGFGALPQPSRGEVLDGHPVFVAVEYDHLDVGRFGDTVVGVHARETYKDAVSIGAGYVEEGRGSAGQPDYELWGVDLRLKHQRKTRLEAEFARSQSQNAENLFSLDGGLTFQPFHLRDGGRARGSSFLLRGGLELDDLIGEGKEDRWYTEAYWQYLAPGFYSGGNLQQQGLESYGALTRFNLAEGHLLRLQHDGAIADDQAGQGGQMFQAFRRDVTRLGHVYRAGRLQLDSELVHTRIENGQGPLAPPDPQAGPFAQQFAGGDLVTDVLNVGLRYDLDERWSLLAEQEVVLRGDARIHQQTADLFASTVGARFKASESLTLELTESVRWSGDNATQLGVRTQLDERHTLYGQQRLINRDGRVDSTTVVGGEERFGANGDGRAFAEYQLESGVLGERNRAVLGVGQRAKLLPGLTLDAGYQRSQVVGGGAGEFSQDALTLGVEWLDSERIKLSGRYEIRYEDNDESAGRRDRLQWLALNSGAFKLHRDLTLLVRFNWSHTVDLGLDATEAELLEGSLGFAWRPVHHDWFALILKYTKRYEQRPADLTVQRPEREEADVVSLMPLVELPYGFQIVEKLAWKRNAVDVGLVPGVVGHTVLWINRLNYHLTDTWDVGGEYRFLRSTLAQNQRHGALLEVNYIIQKTVRLGLGYNFTRFSDDEFSRLDEDHSGPFFRVVAHH